nr:hypothetical protein [Tanacetum cinerariifolium]
MNRALIDTMKKVLIMVVERVADEEKMSMVAPHLEDDARYWFLKPDKDRPHMDWEEFKDHCRRRFGSYGSHTCTCHLRPRQEAEIFISGLQDYIAVEVELQQPTGLTSAMSFARLYERCKSENQLAQQVQRVDVSQTNTPSSTHRPSQYVKRLSRAEIAEQRAKNMCFNCDEIYSAGHHCNQLFYIGMAESFDDDQEPHISHTYWCFSLA